jgi:hypothetical protein
LASSSTSSPSTSEFPEGFKFWEFNRIQEIAKTIYNIDSYLKQRKGWIAVITEKGKSSTIRLDCLTEYINNSQGQNIYTLVKPLYIDQYIQSQLPRHQQNNRNLSSKRIRSRYTSE